MRPSSPELLRLVPPAAAGADWVTEELRFIWRAANEEAVEAYGSWCSTGGGDTYASYRAAQDRADAAQDALALSARSLGGWS